MRREYVGWGLVGGLAGMTAGMLLWSRHMRDAKRDLFHRRAVKRLAALGYVGARPSVENARLLRDFAAWFVQLWAESLGKHTPDGGSVGSTPLPALGATDQHSQVQLFMEGPKNKTVTFISVENRAADVTIPRSFSDVKELGYLGGHSLAELIDIEQRANAGALAKRGRPNLTLQVERVDPRHVGALMMLFELATAYAGQLYGVDPFNQPGVVPAREAGALHHPAGGNAGRGNAGRGNAGPGNAGPMNNTRRGNAVHPNDLPPPERPAPPNTGNRKQDQKYQKQQEKLYAQQEKDRQKLERQQEKEHQQLDRRNADQGRRQQVEERHQQQTQQMAQRHSEQQQRVQQRMPPPRSEPPPKEKEKH